MVRDGCRGVNARGPVVTVDGELHQAKAGNHRGPLSRGATESGKHTWNTHQILPLLLVAVLDRELAGELIRAARRRVSHHRDELSRWDAVAGDGDHGVNMATALTEAVNRLDEEIETPAQVFRTTGRAFHDAVGGAAGALFGAFFGAVGAQLNRSANPATTADLVAGLEKGLARVLRIGRVEPGEKTMVDALEPAVDAARTASGEGMSLAEALSAAARAARQGFLSTSTMRPTAGRARYAADRSVGTPDPGACTVALIFEAWGETAGKADR